ncbi:11108_t:CDS:2, partial [Racocetra fulgida]
NQLEKTIKEFQEKEKNQSTLVNLLPLAVEVAVIPSVRVAGELKHYIIRIAPITKELEEQIIKVKKNGQELTDEGKKYLAELKKLVSGGSSGGGGSSNAPNSNGVLPSNPFPTASNQSPLKAAENRKKELKVVIANLEATSDKTPSQETQLTNKKQELKDIEELEIIIKYFLENSIKRIIIEDEKLIIEYSNGTKKTVEVATNQLKIIRDRMRKVNKNSLSALELEIDYASNPSNQKENKGTNYTPWIVGGSIIGGIALVGGIIFLLTSGRKKIRKL